MNKSYRSTALARYSSNKRIKNKGEEVQQLIYFSGKYKTILEL